MGADAPGQGGLPGDAEIADRLEEAARNAGVRERVWQLAGYTAQEQTPRYPADACRHGISHTHTARAESGGR